ncbi:MAG: hypothetical protein IKW79_01285, partial [Schwartzia sp.]|nr:hypothetical protein [Schwartzia sp. (in: firmicutes)]
MRNIAVFPNIEKKDAPEVLARIIRFFSDKEVRLMLPMDGASFFHCDGYGVEDIERQPMDMALSTSSSGISRQASYRNVSMERIVRGP